MKLLRNPWIRCVLVLLLMALVFFALRAAHVDFSGISQEQFREKINSFGIWGPVLYIIVYILRPLILFPAGILSASAGFIWGLKGLIYLLIAANISSTLEFFIARSFGRILVEKYIRNNRIAGLDKKIEKHGFLAVLLIRIIPNVAWDIQNLSLGLTHVSFRDYFLATFIGIIPGSFAFVFFGSSLIAVLTNPKNFWMIGVTVVIFLGIGLLQKYLKARRGENL
ncbi:MAG: TVP38/TMEM64 family protein [Candidatus Omnitrophica bacterium]|nr:TVP38/TMEM64 family protein [Candidatus Omnitrophota bacterium]